MTKYLDKVGLTEYTKLMKAHVTKSTLKLGESSGTAYDGAKGKANADFIASVKFGNLTLVSPTIKGKWSVTNSAGFTSEPTTINPVLGADIVATIVVLVVSALGVVYTSDSTPALGSLLQFPLTDVGAFCPLPTAG